MNTRGDYELSNLQSSQERLATFAQEFHLNLVMFLILLAQNATVTLRWLYRGQLARKLLSLHVARF